MVPWCRVPVCLGSFVTPNLRRSSFRLSSLLKAVAIHGHSPRAPE
jgi:hypothetical protein